MPALHHYSRGPLARRLAAMPADGSAPGEDATSAAAGRLLHLMADHRPPLPNRDPMRSTADPCDRTAPHGDQLTGNAR